MTRIAFPPTAHHVEMPGHGRRAQRASLALFAATEPSQRAALLGMRGLVATGLTRPLRTVAITPPIAEWDTWLTDEVAARVGAVADVAWYVGRSDRLAGLALAPDGAPIAFVKFHWGVWYPGEDEAAASTALRADPPPSSFAVPASIATGYAGDVRWQIDACLPEGLHRRPPFDIPRLRRVFDELRARLAAVTRPDRVPDTHVLTHGDFTPRNLRLAADGRLWLLDWEGAIWGPPFADEVSYWLVHLSTRLGHRPRRDAGVLLDLLDGRVTRDALAEILDWFETNVGEESRPLREAVSARL